MLALGSNALIKRVALIQSCNKNEHYSDVAAAEAPWDKRWHRYCSNKAPKTTESYAPRKNLTHEPTVGGVQSTSGQHSIVSAAVSDGDTRNGDIVQDRRFQFSRSVRF